MSANGVTRLLQWFRAAARELPWRGPLPRNPYHVLVSEVLAQQTQVDRAAVAYLQFLARFPTVEALAQAGEDDVVAAFSGLGYYRRARLLHGAGRAIAERGSWPEGEAELRRLPGLGPYTAAAVTAFAFGGTTPPVDGNIMRVAARVGRLALPLGSGELLRAASAWAASLYAPVGTPEVFEALMELGACVCSPVSPGCTACPLLSRCEAGKRGDWALYPTPRPARAREAHRWVALWARRADGTVLLRRVAEGKVLLGLWLPPFTPILAEEDTRLAARALAGGVGLAGLPLAELGRIRHSITHRAIEVYPFLVEVPPRCAEAGPDLVFRQPAAPGLPTSSLLAKLARSLDAAAHERRSSCPDQ